MIGLGTIIAITIDDFWLINSGIGMFLQQPL